MLCERLLERFHQRIDYVLRLTGAQRVPWKTQAGRLDDLRLRSGAALVEALMHARGRVGSRMHRLLVARPNLSMPSVRVAALTTARRSAMAARLAHARARVETGLAALAHLGPAQILARGFSIVRDASGALVSDAAGVDIGQTLEVEFARGGASTRVERVLP